ncbi:Uncharacterized protein OBRU01_25527 [Operophtera brumata]|uniref:Cytochrome P450 n=1 Tax=Operophtera brumata TaxID=104452 RepID=A0A0L7K5I4_OPEBR|nr:Uncharacterized protein OBRU01_25527 [Operophtera brumata]
MKLRYLDRVVKESLRLFPPVPFIIRKVLEDTKLPSGRTMPAGSGIAVSIWGLHRDPKYWGPDAEHFDPDRFLPERVSIRTDVGKNSAICCPPSVQGRRGTRRGPHTQDTSETGHYDESRGWI